MSSFQFALMNRHNGFEKRLQKLICTLAAARVAADPIEAEFKLHFHQWPFKTSMP